MNVNHGPPPNGRNQNFQKSLGYRWATDGLRMGYGWAIFGLFLGYKQKWPTEVSHCCRGIPRIYWLRRLDLN
jgi:hypothetical protein